MHPKQGKPLLLTQKCVRRHSHRASDDLFVNNKRERELNAKQDGVLDLFQTLDSAFLVIV